MAGRPALGWGGGPATKYIHLHNQQTNVRTLLTGQYNLREYLCCLQRKEHVLSGAVAEKLVYIGGGPDAARIHLDNKRQIP